MTTKTFAQAIKNKKPAIIKEKGSPRYVVLDWATYQKWQEQREDFEDHIRCEIAIQQSKGKKRYSLKEVKKRYNLN